MRGLLNALNPPRAAFAVFVIALATIAGAWVFEYYGYLPCDLCLKQRWAYYAGVPLAALAAFVAWQSPAAGKYLLFLLALVFAGSAVFGVYHAGVEWGFWPGPAGCTGTAMPRADTMQDFMKQLQTTRIVRCDEVAIRILGLSLAGWNAVVSAGMAAIAAAGVCRARG